MLKFNNRPLNKEYCVRLLSDPSTFTELGWCIELHFTFSMKKVKLAKKIVNIITNFAEFLNFDE